MDRVHANARSESAPGPSGGRRIAILGLIALPGFLFAQTGARPARVGFLIEPRIDDNMQRATLEPFRQELRKLGYEEGRNLVLEVRSAEGNNDRLSRLAEELLQLRIDVLLTAFPAPAMIAKQATSVVPVVAVGVDDPVRTGLAQSMVRPGGNVTGISGFSSELVAKRLQLVREFVPQARRVGILSNPDAVPPNGWSDLLPPWERTLGAQISVYHARAPGEFNVVFDAMARDGIDGLVVLADNNTYTNRVQLNELCLQRRMPSVWGGRDFLTGGGLASYQSDFPSQFRRGAAMVDRILKGERPQTMAFEQSTKLELVIDMRAVKALGIRVPRERLQVANLVLN